MIMTVAAPETMEPGAMEQCSVESPIRAAAMPSMMQVAELETIWKVLGPQQAACTPVSFRRAACMFSMKTVAAPVWMGPVTGWGTGLQG